MAETVDCCRCKRTAAVITGPIHLPTGPADEVTSRVCADCWAEWQSMEIMVINELRLNFMEPGAQDTLHRRMREFFEMDESS